MSRIQTVDEIIAQMGPPAVLRWVNAPYGASAAVVRIRHRGAIVNLSASRTFRLIFQLSSSKVARDGNDRPDLRDTVETGRVITSFSERPEQIRIFGAAHTLQVLFSPEIAAACPAGTPGSFARTLTKLQAAAARALVSSAFDGADAQLEQAVAAIAKLVVEERQQARSTGGGLTPQARRAMLDLLERRLTEGISVPELANAANLSLHHFIKACRQSEGVTPHAVLMQKRMERSIPLLLNPRGTVQEIAMLVGFSSSSHFISAFRRMVGVTPAAIRRAARG